MKTISVLALAVALPFACHAAPPTSAPEPDRKVYAVATAHLDTQWLWTIRTSIDEYILNTLRVNLDLMDKYPDYVFSFEGSFRYKLMKEYYPDLYEKMKQRVKEGRWRVTGSWVDAVDVNIPSPEALIRHNLYGNGFYKKEFGKTSVDIFLPDCFGFGYALPSIAAHCGIKGFSTQKLTWGSAYGIPFNIGVWQGVDGSKIVAAIDAGGYGSEVGDDWNRADWLIKRTDRTGEKSGLYADYRYHGTGDMGGGPSRKSVENLEACIKAGGPIKVLSAGADQLYRDVTPQQFAKLPVYNGELLMTSHGTGCYTSQSAMKRWNRKNELLATAAERAAAMAGLMGAQYPKDKINEAWERFLWHGFHDDLTGTSIPEAYAFSWNDEILSLNQFSEVLSDSIQTVAAGLDTRVKGVPVVVYNPLASSRSDLVKTAVVFGGKAPKFVRVFGPSGKEVPAQVISSKGSTAEVAFVASVGGVSTSVFDVRPAKSVGLKTGISADGLLQNERYQVVVNKDGDIFSIFDRVNKRELLKTPIRLAMMEDKPEAWPAWEVAYRDMLKKPKEFVSGAQFVEVVENGPASVALRVVRESEGSKITQTVRLVAGGTRVDVDCDVAWRSKATMMKGVFNVTTGNPKATYDLGLGTITRGNNRRRLYEVPAQQWADLTDTKGAYGVSIISDSRYGWDKPADDTLRLTLVRTPEAGGSHESSNDIGHHRFGFSIYGHKGDWRNGSSDQGDRVNQPLRAFQVGRSAGKLGKVVSLAEANTPQVSVKALKKAEAGNEWIVRVYENYGRAAKNARVAFGSKVLKVRELNGAEESLSTPTAALKSTGKTVVFDMKPYRPRTFAVTLAAAPVAASKIGAKPLNLPYDLDAVTKQGEAGAGLDSDGHAIPAELWPASLKVEGVPFNLGRSSADNAVVCRGQTIELPKAGRVVLLATSSKGDVTAPFTVGAASVSKTIPHFTGFVGQWDGRLIDGHFVSDPAKMAKAFIKRTPVAWVGTHRHNKDGKVESYQFCYLFKVTLNVPKGAKTLTLPNDPRIKVFAATAVNDARPPVAPGLPLYD